MENETLRKEVRKSRIYSQCSRLVYLWIVAFCIYSLPVTYAANSSASASGAVSIPTSDRLTLELQNVSIFDVFKLLSKKSGLNIIAGKNVQGQVSLFLQDVPARDALKTILQSQGLASIEEDGVIKVMTEDEYLKKRGQPYEDKRLTKAFHLKYAGAELLAAKLNEIKTPYGKILTDVRTNTILITEIPPALESMEKLIFETDQSQETAVFKLNYTKAEDLGPKLKAFMEGSAGKMEVDKRSNRIFAMDIPDRIQKIREMVEAFDVGMSEVLIEAKIVEVQLTDAYRKGIDWQQIVNQLGNINTLKAAIPLAVSPPTGAAALATLSIDGGVDGMQVVFNLLESVGKTNLLSSPRLMVINGEEAKLAVATREPFISQTVVQTVNSTNTADNVQFVDVGVTLKVLPRISHDNFVEMKIKPAVSTSNRSLDLEGVAQGSNTTFTRTKIPIVTTQELETSVQVQSGHTLIIGGLIQDHQSKISTRMPFLSAIPLLGRFFENKTNDFSKTELVIFLTPIIVSKNADDGKEAGRFLDSKNRSKPFDAFGGYKTDIRYDTLIERKYPYWEKPLSAGPQNAKSHG